ncbi:MAG: hypothetical protein JO372_11475 [Solirubrobacterales bacterium]|nr:hypothetical protein [Solirubrobacterales bacterium]
MASALDRSRVPLPTGWRVLQNWMKTALGLREVPPWLIHRPPRPPRWIRVAFTMQTQQQSEWCWSAVATSVSLFYSSASAWTQCSLANAQLGQTTCCQNGSTAQCNQPWYLDRALSETGNLAQYQSGTVALEVIDQQIKARHPIGARIGWQGAGGHFVTITGWLNLLAPDVEIHDPFYGTSQITLSEFTNDYQGNGTWTDSYLTS